MLYDSTRHANQTGSFLWLRRKTWLLNTKQIITETAEESLQNIWDIHLVISSSWYTNKETFISQAWWEEEKNEK